VKQLVSQIPWGHNIALLQKLNTEESSSERGLSNCFGGCGVWLPSWRKGRHGV